MHSKALLSLLFVVVASLLVNGDHGHHRERKHRQVAHSAKSRTRCHPRVTTSTTPLAAFVQPTSSSSANNSPPPSPPATTPPATPATTPTTPSSGGATASSGFTPNGIKAGIAGGDAYPFMKDHLGWWYDWSPNPSKPGSPIAVPMLWGAGTADAQDAARLADFKRLTNAGPYVLGFEEPDCASGGGSAGMSVDQGVADWEQYIAPLKSKGTLLVSPSMCKQIDETWLAEFQKKIKTQWDITAVHINKNNVADVKKVVDHYAKYGKPIWVTEFACVNDNPNFIPCTNQDEINTYIRDSVAYYQSESRVAAYAYSNGLGLGDVWPLGGKDGKLSASGQTYLAEISKYH